MFTARYVRDNLEAIRGSLARRKSKYPLDELLKLDEEWRGIKTRLQELQAKRNKASLEISETKKKSGAVEDGRVAELKAVKSEIAALEAEMPTYEDRIENLLWNMPNVLDESVPYGESEEDNVEVRKWGDPKGSNKKSHEEILTKLDLIDIERAAKISGARFYFLKGDLVLLEQSLIRFTIDRIAKKGYKLLSPPNVLRRKYYKGVTALGDFEDMLYRIGDPEEVGNKKDYEKVSDELFMIGTAEHPMASMHAEEVFAGNDLPVKYIAISPCYRREAGAHGKDTKGIFRVHQFYKVEMFIFSKQEDSQKHFDELAAIEEELLQTLGLPYRVLNFCTGGIGTVAAKKIDLEAWMPSQGRYRELTSCSNCTDWQSTRLDIKYDDKGSRKYVHTLNATAIATTRTLVAIVENYVNADGSITIPDALVPYMGKSKIG